MTLANRPSLNTLPAQARFIAGYDSYAVDFCGNVWSCKGPGGRGSSEKWRKLQPILVRGQLAVQLSRPKQKLLIAETVLTHFGSPKPCDDAIVRHLDHPTKCGFDAICWDLPTDEELSATVKRELRRRINQLVKQHTFRDQRKWHRLANQHAGIRSQREDSVTVQKLKLKLDYLNEPLKERRD